MHHAASECWGNPSSSHHEGRIARDACERARQQVAALLDLPAKQAQQQVMFTSGGTEANNSAILGLWGPASAGSCAAQIITSPLEHPSVLAAVSERSARGARVTYLPVDAQGRWSLADLAIALKDGAAQGGPLLVTLALANHEIGNLYPIAEAAQLCHERGALLHCDAVQALGRIPLSMAALKVDSLSGSAHKLSGPKGVGVLVLSPAAAQRFRPLILGGGQEKGRRAGTENLPAIVGFGAACALRGLEEGAGAARIAALRDRLEARLLRTVPDVHRNGDVSARTPGTSNLAFAGVDGDLLMTALDLRGVAVSTGAACSSGSLEPSPVLRALGQSPARAREAVRFSLGPDNDEAQVDQVASWVEEIVAHIRGL